VKKKEKLFPPVHSTGDTAHLLVKAVLSPIIGAPELFERFISPPLQKRTNEWMKEVAEALMGLQQDRGINIEALQNNGLFTTVVIQATRVAVANHQKEKLNALKNTIINSASSSEAEDVQITFIRFIDELTPSHISLLKFFIDEEKGLETIKSYMEIYELFNDKKSASISKDELRMFIGDLNTRGLLRVSPDIEDDSDIYQASSLLLEETNDNLPRIIVSHVAKRFIRFISTL
jgi:hypothetical protein